MRSTRPWRRGSGADAPRKSRSALKPAERLGLEDANRPKVEIGWGMRLRRARRVAGYKHAEAFAKAIGLEPHTYRTYERAESMPGREALGLISEKLAVSIDWLLYARGKGPSIKLV